jgi:hypothetical protein
MKTYEIMRRYLTVALLLAAVFIAIQIGLFARRLNTEIEPSIHQSLLTLNQSAANLRSITGGVQQYLDLQLNVLRSAREQKAIQAGLEVAAAAKGTVLLINKTVIPRVNKELDALTETTQALNTLVANIDLKVNSDLLPQTAATIKQAENALRAIQDQSETIGADIHSLTSSESIQASLNSLAGASDKLDQSISHVEESLREAPSIAKHIEVVTGNSSKVSKISSLAGIALVLTKIFTLIF